ncbi:MAG TPA: hypothetical protein VMM56_03915 [Planctomycetaceae bacterium]|nr:hypothetical protein [Planctomycetaceae bacterium]
MAVSRREQRQLQMTSDSGQSNPAWCAMARGVAAFFGLFLLYDVFVSLGAGFPWWFELELIPDRFLRGALTFYSVGLIFYALSGREPVALRVSTRILTCLLLMLVLTAIFDWYELHRNGSLDSPVKVPFLLQIAGFLTVILAGVFRTPLDSQRSGGLLLGVIAFDLCVLLIPFSHVYCSGQTSDARPAETIFIFADDPIDGPAAEFLLQKIDALADESDRRKALIAGSSERVKEWRESLQRRLANETLSLQTIDSTGQPQALLEQLSLSSREGVIVVGSPIRLASLRIRLARSEIPATQIALTDPPLKISAVLKSIPDWWRAYLLPVRYNAVLPPTVSIPPTEPE